jgi:hypothetical protein
VLQNASVTSAAGAVSGFQGCKMHQWKGDLGGLRFHCCRIHQWVDGSPGFQISPMQNAAMDWLRALLQYSQGGCPAGDALVTRW